MSNTTSTKVQATVFQLQKNDEISYGVFIGLKMPDGLPYTSEGEGKAKIIDVISTPATFTTPWWSWSVFTSLQDARNYITEVCGV